MLFGRYRYFLHNAILSIYLTYLSSPQSHFIFFPIHSTSLHFISPHPSLSIDNFNPSTIHRPPPTLPLLRRQRLNIPNTLRILDDAPIAGKEAHPTHARDGLPEPTLLVAIGVVHEGLRLDVGVEVVADEIVVAVIEDGGDEGGEVSLVAEAAGVDGGEDGAQVPVDVVRAPVVVRVSEVLDVFGQVAEEEDVAFADLARDFDLCNAELNIRQRAFFRRVIGWDVRWHRRKCR